MPAIPWAGPRYLLSCHSNIRGGVKWPFCCISFAKRLPDMIIVLAMAAIKSSSTFLQYCFTNNKEYRQPARPYRSSSGSLLLQLVTASVDWYKCCSLNEYYRKRIRSLVCMFFYLFFFNEFLFKPMKEVMILLRLVQDGRTNSRHSKRTTSSSKKSKLSPMWMPMQMHGTFFSHEKGLF